MKYRAKIYIVCVSHADGLQGTHITTRDFSLYSHADYLLWMMKFNIEQVTGGHIERYVDGIGWVVCEEDRE